MYCSKSPTSSLSNAEKLGVLSAKIISDNSISTEPGKNPVHIPFCWLFNRDPYMQWSIIVPYNWIVQSPINPKQPAFSHTQSHTITSHTKNPFQRVFWKADTSFLQVLLILWMSTIWIPVWYIDLHFVYLYCQCVGKYTMTIDPLGSPSIYFAPETKLVGGLSQPIWKNMLVKLDHFPKKSGWKFKKKSNEIKQWRNHLHSWNSTWNVKRSPWKRRFLLETFIFRFHVEFGGSRNLV